MNPRADVRAAPIAILLVMCLGLAFFSTDLTTNDGYRTEVESVQGQELLANSFPAGSSAPTDVIVADAADVERVAAAVAAVPGVEAISPPVARGDDGRTLLQATLDAAALLDRGLRPDRADPRRRPRRRRGRGAGRRRDRGRVRRPRRRGLGLDGDPADRAPRRLRDPRAAAARGRRPAGADRHRDPVLRAPRWASAYFAFDVLFGFPGSDPSLPLFAFVFLVALGVDYNIFLAARAREETFSHGTRDGMLRALAVTGGVITSAGIVLAGTFAVLGSLPLVFLTEIGFVVAFGVLLDTFLVRSVLVPAATLLIGPKFWWPSELARTDGGAETASRNPRPWRSRFRPCRRSGSSPRRAYRRGGWRRCRLPRCASNGSGSGSRRPNRGIVSRTRAA